jgi:hypothetical protein
MTAEDRTAAPRRGARRVLALAGVLMAAAAVVLFAVGPGGDGGSGDVPEAGSRFRDEGAAARSLGDVSGRLPLERAVAQLFVAGFQNQRGPSRAWGALLVTDANYVSPTQLRSLTQALDRRVRRRGAAAPLIVADPVFLGDLGPRDAVDLGIEGTPEEARATARR